MDPVLVVTNAAAGTHEQGAVEAAVAVLRAEAEVEVVATSDAAELDTVLAKLEDRVLVVAGGDGSLHAIVNALDRADLLGSTRLGLVPLGTGNDFARGVGLPLEPDLAARVITAGALREVDLIIEDDGTVVVNNVHLGIGAQASRKAEKWKPRLGRLGYAVGAVSAGLRPEFIRATVTVDGKAILTRKPIAQVAIGNGSQVGGGTELIPGAEPFSGHLVVILSRTVARWKRIAYMIRLKAGSHHLMKEVMRLQARTVTVEGGDFWVTADGEISGPHTSRRWDLRPGAVRMYLPPSH